MMKPRRKFHLLPVSIIPALLLACAFLRPISAEEIDAVPCNPSASADAGAVLRYLARLSSPDVKQAIVGQNCYHGIEITDQNELNGYDNLVTELYQRTGHWLALVGEDYEFMKMYTPEELSAANRVLTAHWKKGGLVTINFSPINPWTLPEGGAALVPATWNGPGSPMDRSRARLADLLDQSSSVYAGWRKKLDRMADALTELRDVGVVVLWRPLQEMNGDWFWWGADPAGYIAVYRDMYRYFTAVKNLDNLLWVYSPFGNINDFRTYPGDDYVDIVAPTCYDDRLVLSPASYRALAALGHPHKPLAMGEYGPTAEGEAGRKGTLDTTLFIKRIREDYPRISYWVCWHSYPDTHWSIISLKNYQALLDDPNVITLDRLKWKQE